MTHLTLLGFGSETSRNETPVPGTNVSKCNFETLVPGTGVSFLDEILTFSLPVS